MDKQEEKAKSTAIAVTTEDVNTTFGVINLLDSNQLAAAESLLKRIIQSDKFGIKSIQDGLAIILRAQDLRLPFSACCEQIHVINGKTGLGIHIIKALLSRAGVTWDCTKDYAPQYQYTDGNTIYLETQLPEYCIKCRTAKEAEAKTSDDVIGVYPVKWYTDLKGNIYNEFQCSDKCVIALNKAHAMKIAADGKFPIIRVPAQPVDYVSEYKFTRYQIINGKEIVRTCTSHFSFSEAQVAELIDKENYRKYGRIMVSTRAFTLGARDIADDLLMGCMEVTELKQANNIKLDDNDYADVEVIESSTND